MRNGASDKLFHYGEDDTTLSFDQLMALYGRMIDEELRLEKNDDEWTKENFPKTAQAMRDAKDAALEIYHRRIQEAAQEMQNSDDDNLQAIGRALETGDWSQVTI